MLTNPIEAHLMALEDAHSSGAYSKRDLEIVRGDGAWLMDSRGRRYIDCVGGQGAANLGHGHPAVIAALEAQMRDLMICPELFHNPVRARYQAALCQAAGMARVFLCSSGAEAVESAIKIARLTTGRRGVIAAMRGFHGRTLGALSATWEKHYRDPFAPLVPEFTHIPFNNLDRLADALTADTAAVILEVVQGEGGVHAAAPGYLAAARDLCAQNGTLLILDEVQTGFGRTGQLFAHQYDGVTPDLLCLAKSIGGGLPMGAVLMHESIPPLPAGTHGSTFGGNPLACAAGLAVLDVLQSTDLVKRTQARGAEVMQYLREHVSPRAAREVRGRGLMIGIELRGKVAPVLRALSERGVLALPAGPTVLRLLPPLVIEDDALWQAAETIVEVVNDVL